MFFSKPAKSMWRLSRGAVASSLGLSLAAVRRGSVGGINLVFPPSCLLCGSDMPARHSLPLLCEECVGNFGYRGAPVCAVCAAPLPKIGERAGNCLYCEERRYRFAASWALGMYEGKLRDAVLRMKLAAYEPLSLSIGAALADYLPSQLGSHAPDLAVPVPMHWWRRWHRGANCPDLLAESVAERLRIPAAAGLLKCRRRAKKQGTLLPGERFRNMAGAFRVSPNYDIQGAKVLLVDDIMTTGATANAATKVLRRAGAKAVFVAVVARGIGLDDQPTTNSK